MYVCMYVCCVCVCYVCNLCLCMYVYVYLGSISSLMHISLNVIDMFCLHIFVYVLSSCQIDFIVSSNFAKKLTLYISLNVHWGLSDGMYPHVSCIRSIPAIPNNIVLSIVSILP